MPRSWIMKIEEIDGEPGTVWPEEVVADLGLKDGDELELDEVPGGYLIRRSTSTPA